MADTEAAQAIEAEAQQVVMQGGNDSALAACGKPTGEKAVAIALNSLQLAELQREATAAKIALRDPCLLGSQWELIAQISENAGDQHRHLAGLPLRKSR